MIPDEVIEAMASEIFWRTLRDKEAKREEVRAALQAAEAKGWKLVPREPTQKMEGEGYSAGHDSDDQYSRGNIACILEGAWPAMWDAAPKVNK